MKTCKRCKHDERVVGEAGMFKDEHEDDYVCFRCLSIVEVAGLDAILKVVNDTPPVRSRKWGVTKARKPR